MARARWRAAAVGLLVASGCGKETQAPASDGGEHEASSAPGPTAATMAAIALAEDLRRAADVPRSAGTDHDVAVRRRAARALARIGDPASEEELLHALSDEDEETAGWASYGLGWACKGREDTRVRALAARAASLSYGADAASKSSGDTVDARMAVARAVGRCGGQLAEQVLTAWLRSRGPWAERAAFALGDMVAHRTSLANETLAALVDAASGTPSVDAALYPLGRLERVEDALTARVVAAAHAALARPGEGRAFAIRALSRTGRDGVADLVRVVESKEYGAAERAEASRGLRQLGEAGRLGVAEALGRLTPDKDPVAITGLGGDEFGVLRALVGALGDDAPKAAEPALFALAALRAPGEVPPPLARRLAELRCSAAAALARGAYEADVLVRCDGDGTSEAAQRARLAALGHRPLVGERRAAWKALTKSPNLRIREAALGLMNEHPELALAAREALIEAFGSDKPGVVTTAAEVVHGHPDRVLGLADREKRAALDPNEPGPTASPARELDGAVAKALTIALVHAWAEDLIETRAALLDAAVAVHLPAAREAAARACRDPNVTMREHAQKALRAEGDGATLCNGSPAAPRDTDAGSAAVSVSVPGPADRPLARPTRVTFATDAGSLVITFDPELAPLAAARFVALARGGFYRGIVAHRVVPGFVVQFGDPGGDGYGGSGKLLRCETSPVPFGHLDVGVALAGRDTGTSQLFVALGRFPNLDGDYARVGHAEGDWEAVAEGDLINDVKVEE